MGVEDIQVHPATMRQEIIAASRNRFDDVSSESDSDQREGDEGDGQPSERTNLLRVLL